MESAKVRLWRVLPRLAVLVLMAGALSGCIVVPVRPYHPWYGYYYR